MKDLELRAGISPATDVDHFSGTMSVAMQMGGACSVFLLSCAVFVLSSRVIRHDPAWRTFEFCQYAEIGKNISYGTGYRTRLIEPMALAYIDHASRRDPGPPWPVINRFPMPCFVTALLMLILGPTDMAAAWSNGLAVSSLAALAFILTYRLYGAMWACLASLVFLSNPSFYGYFVLLGTPDIWFSVWFTLQLVVWVRLLNVTPFAPHWSILFGLVTGVCYATRYNVVIFFAVQLLFLLVRRRWKDTSCVIASATAVVMPFILYNWIQFGRPMVSIYSTWNLLDRVGAFTVEPWLYYRVPDLLSVLVDHWSGVVRKIAINLFTVVPLRIWTLWHLYMLIPLALFGPLFNGFVPRGRMFFRWAYLLFAIQLVAFSAMRLEFEHRLSPHHGRYFFWFAVPGLMAAIGALVALKAKWPVLFRWCLPCLIACQLAWFASTWWTWAIQNREPIYLGRDPIRAWLAQQIRADQVVASNQPQILAWYSGLTAISLPADLDEVRMLNRTSSSPIDFLFLDLNYNSIELDERWAMLVRPTASGAISPWEQDLLRDYEYVRPPTETRPFLFVLLRRRDMPQASDDGFEPSAGSRRPLADNIKTRDSGWDAVCR